MARKAPEYHIRHFRKDGVTQFTEIPLEPDVLDYLREVFDGAIERMEKRKKETA